MKPTLSLLAILITFFAFVPYIHSIYRGSVRPHVFSWIIWAITTIIVFFAQWSAKGGVGAWPIGISGCITLGVAILALCKRADIKISRSDTLFFILAITSLPLWFFTADPLWAVVVLTIVDLLGFVPTFSKAFNTPQSESVLFFALFALRNFLVILALEHYSVTTVLFPAAIGSSCVILIAIIVYRRRLLIKDL